MGELTQSDVRRAFDEQVAAFIADVIETDRPSLSEILTPATLNAVRATLAEAADSVASRAEEFLDSAEFEERVQAFVTRTRAELGRKTVKDLLSAEQKAALAEKARTWASEFAASPDLEGAIRQYLERHAEALVASQKPVFSHVPPALLHSLEGAIESYLPLAAEKLGAFLSQPASREKLRGALHDLFRRLVKDLEFHQRLIARLMITERSLDKALDTLGTDGIDQLAALLEDELVRAELAKSLREAMHSFLARPLADLVGGGERASERAEALTAAAGDYLLRVLRDERTHGFLVARIGYVLESAEDRTVGELVSGIGDDQLVAWVASGARSDKARQFLRERIQLLFAGALTMRIGRPARWLPDDAAGRLAAFASPAIWNWIVTQLPMLVKQLNVEAMVERKVAGFSTARMEEIIRTVTERELRLIVKLGYLLGASIGLMTFAISRFFQSA
jgi:uncharacterized membrane protein YheB (UPF0754 family)